MPCSKVRTESIFLKYIGCVLLLLYAGGILSLACGNEADECADTEICFGGIDEDCDGDRDCADSDCEDDPMCGPVLHQRLLVVIQTEDVQESDLNTTRYAHIDNEIAEAETMFIDFSNGRFHPHIERIHIPDTAIYSEELANWGGAECMPDQSDRLRGYILDAGLDPDDFDGFFRLFDVEDVEGMTARNGTECEAVYGGNAFTDGTVWALLRGNGLCSISLGWWSWSAGEEHWEEIAPYMVHEYTHMLDIQFEDVGELRFINPDTKDDAHAPCIDNSTEEGWRRSNLTYLESEDGSQCFPIDWTVLNKVYGSLEWTLDERAPKAYQEIM